MAAPRSSIKAEHQGTAASRRPRISSGPDPSPARVAPKKMAMRLNCKDIPPQTHRRVSGTEQDSSSQRSRVRRHGRATQGIKKLPKNTAPRNSSVADRLQPIWRGVPRVRGAAEGSVQPPAAPKNSLSLGVFGGFTDPSMLAIEYWSRICVLSMG